LFTNFIYKGLQNNILIILKDSILLCILVIKVFIDTVNTTKWLFQLQFARSYYCNWNKQSYSCVDGTFENFNNILIWLASKAASTKNKNKNKIHQINVTNPCQFDERPSSSQKIICIPYSWVHDLYLNT
jgi:hypothetical protein